MNKKANIGLFGFFFILTIISALMLFLGVGMHFILNQELLGTVTSIGDDLLDNATNVARINDLQTDHYNLSGVFDLLFLVFMVSIFIQSIISAIKAKRMGWFSFFGFLTIGNFILGLVLYFAIQIRGWFLNDIFYNVITESFNSTWFDYFVNNTWWLIFVWYIILIVFSFVDVSRIVDKFTSRDDNIENITDGSGRFEE